MRVLGLMCCLTLVAALACGDLTTSPDPFAKTALLAAADSDDSDEDDLEVELEGQTFAAAAGGLRVLTIDAESEDGSAEGTYRVELTGPGLFFEVQVSCMVAEGNIAWVAGHISASNAGFIQIGSVSYFYAIDNGEDEADVVSTARINDIEGEDELFCRDRPRALPEQTQDGGDLELEVDD